MSPRSIVTLMCFLHGPTSVIKTNWSIFSGFSSAILAAFGAMDVAGLIFVFAVWSVVCTSSAGLVSVSVHHRCPG